MSERGTDDGSQRAAHCEPGDAADQFAPISHGSVAYALSMGPD